MKKPVYQWETRRLRARRRPSHPGGDWLDDPRAERFDLELAGGGHATAVFGLRLQRVDAMVADDPDLVHAARCWIAARGGRSTDLQDDAGRVIDRGPFELADLAELPDDVPGRLVTLAPSVAELVDALGAFGRVIACEDSSDHPPAVERCIRLGPDLAPDLEAIATLSPDLVLSSLTVPGMERTVTGLRARGIPQVVLAPRSFDDVVAEARTVGALLGVATRAEGLVDEMLTERDRLLDQRGDQPVRVYLEWWPRPMYSPGRDCYSNELIALAGGVNVFGDRPGSSVEITADELVEAQPDVCFVSWCGVAEHKLDPANLIARAGLGSLPAVLAGRVYALDERFSGRPGPRMLEAARRMADAIARSGLRP